MVKVDFRVFTYLIRAAGDKQDIARQILRFTCNYRVHENF